MLRIGRMQVAWLPQPLDSLVVKNSRFSDKGETVGEIATLFSDPVNAFFNYSLSDISF